jgi:hypothetical protein
MKRIALVATLGLLCVRCTTLPLSGDQKNAVNDVAIVTVYDGAIAIRAEGSNIFKSDNAVAYVTDWKLDDIIFHEAESRLISVGKKSIAVKFDQAKIKALTEHGDTTANYFLGSKMDERNDYLFTTALNQGAHYLLIFSPVHPEKFKAMHGFGLICHGGFGRDGDWEPLVYLHVALWDLNSKQKIFQNAYYLLSKSGRPCDDAKDLVPEKFASSFKDQFQAMTKDEVSILLDKSGLTK